MEQVIDKPSTETIWMSGLAAKKLAGIAMSRLHKLALTGRIRTMSEPGSPVKFHREDVERVRDEQTKSSSD